MSQALLAADAGSVVTWGNAEFGADSSAMQTQLKNVQQIHASDGAFAAILDAEDSVDSPGMLLLRSYGCLFLVLIWLVRNSLGGGPFRHSKISKLQEPRPAAHKICILSLSFGRLRGVWWTSDLEAHGEPRRARTSQASKEDQGLDLSPLLRGLGASRLQCERRALFWSFYTAIHCMRPHMKPFRPVRKLKQPLSGFETQDWQIHDSSTRVQGFEVAFGNGGGFFTRCGVSPKALFGWSVQENAAWNKAKVHPSRQG
eukprot:s8013_g3.t1